MFTLNLLGPVSAAIDGNQFTRFGTNRGKALLIYLALERERAHQREAIMHLLWPDMPLKSAQGNLRQTLYLLRKGFQDEDVDVSPILSARQTVQINPTFPLTVDVYEFETGTGGGTPERGQEAAELYRGPFLSDFFLPDSEPFETWLAEKRATYGRLALNNLDRLAAHYLAGAEYAAADTAARRALALDDLHEPAHRLLLKTLAAEGRRGDALTHYDAFARQQSRYHDGVHFVDLAPLESSDQVAPAIAEVFAFPLQGERRSPEEQMLDYLREKELLIILDNFEHIPEATTFLNDILHSAPGVRVLATSRDRLRLSSEQIYTLEGLTYPPAPAPGRDDLVDDIESYSAVQLLLRRARHVQPGYELQPEDQEPGLRICRTTAGMPLAIELAAAWVDLLPLSEIAAEVEQRLDMLEMDLRDLPERHRSIRAAIDTTWEHLRTGEQRLFALLSVFRGDFTWEAVAAVLGNVNSDMQLRRAPSTLRDKLLLSYDARARRFTIHDLLRQFGAEKLGGMDKARQGENSAAA